MDASEDDLRKNIEALDKNTAMLARIFDGTQKSDKARASSKASNDSKYRDTMRRSTRQINDAASALTGHFKALGSGADGLLHHINGLIGGIIGGAEVAELIKYGNDLTKTYRDLTNIGQAFSGSMIDMAAQAGAAGLPLGQFAELLRKNSTAAAVLAAQSDNSKDSLGGLQKAVRNNTRDMGFYGMSISQIGDLTGDYTETLRLQDRIGKQNTSSTALQIQKFAQTITDFSTITGKSRDEIAKATFDAMHDPAFLARSTDFSNAQNEATQRALAFTASMPGSAGPILSKMLSQTLAYGSSIFSDEMQTFAQAGGAEFLGIMDDMANQVKKGSFSDVDAANNLHRMKSYYANNKESLLFQAQAGNQQAKTILEIMQQMNGISEAQYISQLKQANKMKGITLFFSKIEDALDTLSGDFLEAVMNALKPLERDGEFPDLIRKFEGNFKAAGTWFGNIINNLISGDGVNKVADVFNDILIVSTQLLHGFEVLSKVVSGIAFIFDKLRDGITSFISYIIPSTGKDKDSTDATKSMVQEFMLATAGIFLFRNSIKSLLNFFVGAPLRGIGRLMGFGGSRVSFNPGASNRWWNHSRENPSHRSPLGGEHVPPHTGAARPRRGILGGLADFGMGILGGGGGDCCEGIMGGLDALKERVDFHGNRAGAAARTAEELAIDAAKTGVRSPLWRRLLGGVTEAGLKVAKIGAKLLPVGLGVAAGVAGTTLRYSEGDNRGATLEALSTAAAADPGPGTVAAMAIQAELIARDLIGHDIFDKLSDINIGIFGKLIPVLGQIDNISKSIGNLYQTHTFSGKPNGSPDPKATQAYADYIAEQALYRGENPATPSINAMNLRDPKDDSRAPLPAVPTNLDYASMSESDLIKRYDEMQSVLDEEKKKDDGNVDELTEEAKKGNLLAKQMLDQMTALFQISMALGKTQIDLQQKTVRNQTLAINNASQ